MTDDWSVYGFLEWEDHAVCLYKIKNNVRTFISMPGGRKNVGEIDPIETLIREIFEETGITIQRDQIVDLHIPEMHSILRRRNKRCKAYRHYYQVIFYRVALTKEQFEQRHLQCEEGDIVVVKTRTISSRSDFIHWHRDALAKAELIK